MPSMVCIGLAFNHSLAYCRGILRGIRHYARSKPDWVLLPVAAEPRAVKSLGKLGVAGLIAHAYTVAQVQALSRLARPVVNVSGVLIDAPFVRVGVDNDAVGKLAGQHLLDCGLWHFGFVGHHGQAYSIQREAGFRSAVEGGRNRSMPTLNPAVTPLIRWAICGHLTRPCAPGFSRCPDRSASSRQ